MNMDNLIDQIFTIVKPDIGKIVADADYRRVIVSSPLFPKIYDEDNEVESLTLIFTLILIHYLHLTKKIDIKF